MQAAPRLQALDDLGFKGVAGLQAYEVSSGMLMRERVAGSNKPFNRVGVLALVGVGVLAAGELVEGGQPRSWSGEPAD